MFLALISPHFSGHWTQRPDSPPTTWFTELCLPCYSLTIRFSSVRFIFICFVEFSCRRHSPMTTFKFIDCLTKDDTNHFSKISAVLQSQWNGQFWKPNLRGRQTEGTQAQWLFLELNFTFMQITKDLCLILEKDFISPQVAIKCKWGFQMVTLEVKSTFDKTVYKYVTHTSCWHGYVGIKQ